ncbi:MAG: type II toxin-antitoxin system RelE/ParE family toxin [Candidatus Diapherotrites archaeon]|nr:type II toxin-antitoxin system RelE/ParE family toxin [Candidatus Diapherotrites archaeon]
MYQVVFEEDFKKEFKKLDSPIQQQIKKKLFELQENPGLGKHLIGLPYWSLRVGKYRIIYKINEETKQVFLLKVNDRGHIYKEL